MIGLPENSPPNRRTGRTPLAGLTVQLRIDLRHARPPIWRRIVVPGDINLHRLHAVLQTAMGWTDSHLHAFRQSGHEYTLPDPDASGWADPLIHDERRHTLADLVAREGDAFQYDYDFGDSWEHDLRVEALAAADPRPKHARCLAGRRACPPEDCGGIGGYFEVLHALAHPKLRASRERLDWLGPGFDPAHFDVGETNALLQGVPV